MEEARPVRPEELGQTLALVNKVFRTGVDQDMSTDYPLVFTQGNLENLRVVSEGGGIFSHAAMARRELREHGCRLPVSMICAVATDGGEPVTTELMRYGLRVTVLGFPAPELWTTPQGLAEAGPHQFGYDTDYIPLQVEGA